MSVNSNHNIFLLECFLEAPKQDKSTAETMKPVGFPEQTIQIALDEPVESSLPNGDKTRSGEIAFKPVTISIPLPEDVQPAHSHLNIEPVSFIEPLKNVDAIEGDDVTFDCVISGSHPLGIQWYKNKNPIQSDEQKYFTEVKHNELRLIVKDATPDDIGDYRCTVGNDRSQASSDAHLSVKPNPSTWTPPEFTKVPQDVVSIAGNTVKFEAKISGRPEPEILWLKDNKPVQPSTRHQIIDEDGVQSLVITNCTPDDSGEYTLEARNDAGLSTCPFTLSLEDDTVLPKFIRKLHDTTLPSGSSLELTTTFVGTPEPEVTWFLDGESLVTSPGCRVVTEEGTSKLLISQVEPEDAGNYKCVARNNVGKATTGCGVVVEDLMPGNK
jgi:titin